MYHAVNCARGGSEVSQFRLVVHLSTMVAAWSSRQGLQCSGRWGGGFYPWPLDKAQVGIIQACEKVSTDAEETEKQVTYKLTSISILSQVRKEQ